MNDTDDRLIAVMGSMASSTNAGDGEAVAAFRQATKMLKRRGLTWRDVAQRAFGGEERPAGAARPAEAPTPPPPPPPPPPSPRDAYETRSRRRRVHGADVPTTIVGVVRVVDPHLARKSDAIFFEVEGDAETWGPLMAHAGPLGRNVIDANGRRAMLRVRPPRGAVHPQVVACSQI